MNLITDNNIIKINSNTIKMISLDKKYIEITDSNNIDYLFSCNFINKLKYNKEFESITITIGKITVLIFKDIKLKKIPENFLHSVFLETELRIISGINDFGKFYIT